MIYGEENTVPVPSLDLLTFLFGMAVLNFTGFHVFIACDLADSCIHAG